MNALCVYLMEGTCILDQFSTDAPLRFSVKNRMTCQLPLRGYWKDIFGQMKDADGHDFIRHFKTKSDNKWRDLRRSSNKSAATYSLQTIKRHRTPTHSTNLSNRP